jgi:hypothetical protein
MIVFLGGMRLGAGGAANPYTPITGLDTSDEFPGAVLSLRRGAAGDA